MEKMLYFAYGSNVNSKMMLKTCPSANVLGTGFIEGYKLSFMGNRDNAIACLIADKNSKTPAVVWELNTDEIKQLTNYVSLPYLYTRTKAKIKLNKKTLEGYMYLPVINLRACPPSEEYYSVLAEGYKMHGLNEEYLKKALEEVTA